MKGKKSLVSVILIEQQIFLIRGQRVMFDRDLAKIYAVSTKRLNEQVKRNQKRFPQDFMFQLTSDEMLSMDRSQFATGSQKYRNLRYLPYVFTEHGAVMLASVLNSLVAVQASVEVVRAFVRLRTILAAHKELSSKLDSLERKYDAKFKTVFEAIRKLMDPSVRQSKKPIGYQVG